VSPVSVPFCPRQETEEMARETSSWGDGHGADEWKEEENEVEEEEDEDEEDEDDEEDDELLNFLCFSFYSILK
jgi:hypothetical protein